MAEKENAWKTSCWGWGECRNNAACVDSSGSGFGFRTRETGRCPCLHAVQLTWGTPWAETPTLLDKAFAKFTRWRARIESQHTSAAGGLDLGREDGKKHKKTSKHTTHGAKKRERQPQHAQSASSNRA